MATASTPLPNQKKKKKETGFPPRRGQVKARIFESIFKTFGSAASKASKPFVVNISGGGGNGGGEGGESSASTTPPESGYNSDFS